MNTDAETLWYASFPPSASVTSSSVSRNLASETLDAGKKNHETRPLQYHRRRTLLF